MSQTLGTRPAGTRWELWSTYAFLAVSDEMRLAGGERRARALLDRVEAACSRFREDSDLSRVNAHPGRWVPVDPLLVEAVDAALKAAEATDGLVDPCLGRTMVALGYDADLRELRRLPASACPPAPPRPGAWRDVRLDDDAVRVPEDVALDLGAVAKAWASDLVAVDLADSLGCTVVVSLGGDLRVAGPDGAPASWPVRVAEHPEELETDRSADVVVTGGLATSTTTARRWGRHDEMHHVVDPRTGQPARGRYRTVTAGGVSCVAANTASTAALVLGEAAPAWLEQHEVTARLVDDDGSVRTVGAWPR